MFALKLLALANMEGGIGYNKRDGVTKALVFVVLVRKFRKVQLPFWEVLFCCDFGKNLAVLSVLIHFSDWRAWTPAKGT